MYRVLCDDTSIFDPRDEELVLIDPVLDLEANTSGSFVFVITPNHPHYELPEKLTSVITVYQDKSYTFILKTPPAAVLIKKAAGVQKGSGNPLRNKVGTLSQKSLEEIAKQKLPDLNAQDLEAAKKIIAGTARSMGVEVEAN